MLSRRLTSPTSSSAPSAASRNSQGDSLPSRDHTCPVLNDLLANTNHVPAAETIGTSAVSFPDRAASSHASAFSRALLFFLGGVAGFAGASDTAFAGLAAGRAFFRHSHQTSAKSRCPKV